MVVLDERRPLYESKANLSIGLAHPYRIRALEMLSAAAEAPVADVVAETGLQASHLSQHISALRR
ncbi:ArsR family transcriptional regulator [Salinibacterium sp. SWN167]|uniref:ArsR family transcriptional regulator n=1 Tax=Salinibacterium sp. SWN167 TaxID=2792054 RepID=UPI0018CCF443|nr:ArsR family transcriptional regulator [Salinibacterium sp. SWN167]MBH0084340.1 ArsR family transcriptional regulator [Salinibacterium sp. SWN167]